MGIFVLAIGLIYLSQYLTFSNVHSSKPIKRKHNSPLINLPSCALYFAEIPSAFEYIRSVPPRALIASDDCQFISVKYGYSDNENLNKLGKNQRRVLLLRDAVTQGMAECMSTIQGKNTTCKIVIQENGWMNKQSRPYRFFYPGLTSRSIWNADLIPEAKFLEKNFDTLLEDYQLVIKEGRLKIHPEKLADNAGEWQIFTLYSGGVENTNNTKLVPKTKALLVQSVNSAITMSAGLTYFSVLIPGGHVKVHYGAFNHRIRIHIGLETPPGAKIVLMDEEVFWKRGKALVFDDSFRHEVFHDGNTPRAVFIADIWHPDLSERERELITQNFKIKPRIEKEKK